MPPTLENSPDDHLAIGLDDKRLHPPRDAAGCEGRIQRTISIEPRQVAPWYAVEGREFPANDQLSISLHGHGIDSAVDAASRVECAIHRPGLPNRLTNQHSQQEDEPYRKSTRELLPAHLLYAPEPGCRLYLNLKFPRLLIQKKSVRFRHPVCALAAALSAIPAVRTFHSGIYYCSFILPI